jgi:ABC-type multidrug transport system ATPase subunit
LGAEDQPVLALPGLHLVVEGRRVVVAADRRVVIGRGADADIRLADPVVSRCHALLAYTGGGWILTDRSRNGMFVAGRRVTELAVREATTVSLGAPRDGVVVELVPEPDVDALGRITSQGRLSGVHHLRSASCITVGRQSGNDVVIDDLLVSRRHAELRRTSAGWEIVDLASGNGTFVNGVRVARAPIGPDDVIGVGRGLLQLRGDRLVAAVDVGDNPFDVRDISVTTAQGDPLLHGISFALSSRTLLGVIGPSGAGKSTLLHALVGSRPADTGDVRYADRSIYAEYDELRHRIALVPQDDVLHSQLTVAAALGYAARLRFPADTSDGDRRRRIDEVLDSLGLTEHSGKRITQLSGGQRKRTSVALELLTRPSLLFLDEPTSGLDPGMDRSVMRTLRTLADDTENPRTVVVVTHNVANLEVCDRLLLLAKGGWLAYFGPPREALEYFQRADYADIFLLLDERDGEEWATRFRSSPLHRRYLAGDEAAAASPRRCATPEPAPRQQGALTQLAVLCRRYVAVIAADRQYAIFLAVLPLMLSLLARAVPGSAGLSVSAAAAAQDRQPGQLLLVLVIGAALMGAAASIRELVKERAIYARERAIGLSLGAYVTSKVVVLSAVTALQATLFTALSLLGRNQPDDPLVMGAGYLEILAAVLGAAVTTMLIGLTISAFIDNADRGMPLLVLMIMVQLIFCGGLFEVHGRPVLEQLAWLAPARWAFAMAASTTELGRLDRGTVDPLWEHDAVVWAADAVILLGMAAALTGVAAVLLLRLDPGRRSRRRG